MEGEYTVQYGQNIFDVCLSIYGSIEGLLDLMVSNPGLSIDTELKYGDKLLYTPFYTEDDAVLKSYEINSIIPSNGIGNLVYATGDRLFMLFRASGKQRTFTLSVSGSGPVSIEWGDGSGVETYELTANKRFIEHLYGYDDTEAHTIKLYGDAVVYELNLSGMLLEGVYMTEPTRIDSLYMRECGQYNLGFLSLTQRPLNLYFGGSRIDSLIPLIDCKTAYNIDVADCGIGQAEIDSYLISLVKDYGERLACTVNISRNARPSGEYKEPNDLLNPQTGMEAIYVIVNHHKEYNGTWAFIIDDKIYS